MDSWIINTKKTIETNREKEEKFRQQIEEFNKITEETLYTLSGRKRRKLQKKYKEYVNKYGPKKQDSILMFKHYDFKKVPTLIYDKILVYEILTNYYISLKPDTEKNDIYMEYINIYNKLSHPHSLYPHDSINGHNKQIIADILPIMIMRLNNGTTKNSMYITGMLLYSINNCPISNGKPSDTCISIKLDVIKKLYNLLKKKINKSDFIEAYTLYNIGVNMGFNFIDKEKKPIIINSKNIRTLKDKINSYKIFINNLKSRIKNKIEIVKGKGENIIKPSLIMTTQKNEGLYNLKQYLYHIIKLHIKLLKKIITNTKDMRINKRLTKYIEFMRKVLKYINSNYFTFLKTPDKLMDFFYSYSKLFDKIQKIFLHDFNNLIKNQNIDLSKNNSYLIELIKNYIDINSNKNISERLQNKLQNTYIFENQIDYKNIHKYTIEKIINIFHNIVDIGIDNDIEHLILLKLLYVHFFDLINLNEIQEINNFGFTINDNIDNKLKKSEFIYDLYRYKIKRDRKTKKKKSLIKKQGKTITYILDKKLFILCKSILHSKNHLLNLYYKNRFDVEILNTAILYVDKLTNIKDRINLYNKLLGYSIFKLIRN